MSASQVVNAPTY